MGEEMTKRKPTPRRIVSPEDQVLTDERAVITNFEEVRLAQRGLDTFTIVDNDGVDSVVLGHEIGMAANETEVANLPIYQIIEYVPVQAEARYTRAYSPGEVFEMDKQIVKVEHVEDSRQIVKVVKAILWPGTWKRVTRVLGE